MSVEDRIESLYIRRRFEDALAVANNAYNKPMLAKIQNAHFNQLIKTNDYEQAQRLISLYF